MGREIAHYYCELAQSLIDKGHLQAALSHLQNSLSSDRNCVRASILQGDVEKRMGNLNAALHAWQQVEKQDPDFIPEIITKVVHCFGALNLDKKLQEYLEYLLQNSPSISVILTNAERIQT